MTEPPGASEEQPIGTVTHYFSRLGVMAMDLSDTLEVGATIHVRGHTTDLVFTVDSMQIEHQQVAKAGPGQSVGIRAPAKVRPGDHVYRVA